MYTQKYVIIKVFTSTMWIVRFYSQCTHCVLKTIIIIVSARENRQLYLAIWNYGNCVICMNNTSTLQSFHEEHTYFGPNPMCSIIIIGLHLETRLSLEKSNCRFTDYFGNIWYFSKIPQNLRLSAPKWLSCHFPI